MQEMDNSLLSLTLLKIIRWHNKTSTTIPKHYIKNQFVFHCTLIPSGSNQVEVSIDSFNSLTQEAVSSVEGLKVQD